MSEFHYSLISGREIPEAYRNTPIEELILYHNEKRPVDIPSEVKLVIATCMDNRVNIRCPAKFAYFIRNGGTSLIYSDFHISYAIAVAKIKYVCVIGHTDCGMSNLKERREVYVKGMQEIAGWKRYEAEDFFDSNISTFEIGDEVFSVLKDVRRLREKFPAVTIVPMIYNVEDNLLYFIKE